FNVFVAIPNNLQGQSMFGSDNFSSPISNISGLISMRASQARTPQATIQWVEVQRYGIGPVQEQPYNVKFSDVWISLIVDKHGMLWNFFHQWMNGTFSF